MLSSQHEVFLEVARRLSFTKASQSLFISQSAVSKQVKALEEYYKVGLFERLGNSVALTPAGQLLYRKLLQAQQLQAELREEMAALSPRFAPQIQMTIGASTTVSLYVLPPVLSAYLAEHPHTQLTLKNRNSENILKALLEHEIDLGVVEGIHRVSQVTYTPLLTDDVVAVCSARNPLRHRTLAVSELYDVPLALREAGSGTLAVLEQALLAQRIRLADLRVPVRLGGTEALKNFVRADDGVLAFLPRQAVARALSAGELAEVTVQDLQLKRHFEFVQRRGTENLAPFREFMQFALRYYSKAE
ncbi:LysR substrate-binding domain-containing protein [Hymenobacter sp. CRA2]|uniref:LysR substrate-binding domain-containing protein n=1 Tax=Hymenobacter sp. CRA2 TaxID=1955620 RepID=UPI00098F5247|nr:LysR substrate-binding domain-containing protein [Hymenobacter sp. CRA2]OON67421.1 LysR family transcriptional regulator [Hymenobacter sp. CRA2]